MSSLDLLGISSSNHPCSDAERRGISSLLAQLQPLRDQQLQMLADTTDKIDRCQIALAPHRRVPPEILREIFIWCSRDQAVFREYNCEWKFRSRELPQLAVSRVCSDWRTIALSTPRLWNNIQIRYLNKISMKHAIRWLLRVGNVPVFIEIWRIDSWLLLAPRGVYYFLSHHRLKGLEFPLYLDGPFPDNLAEASRKDLEELSIHKSSDTPEPLSLETARYPSLIRLYIRVPILNIQPSATVRRLEIISSISTSQFWDFLRGFPLLEEALFFRLAASVDNTSTPKDVHNSSLKQLRANFESEFQIDFGYIIGPLTLPRLANLIISLPQHAQWSPTAYSRMAQRSNFFPHLKNIYLECTGTVVVDVDSLLTCTPYLRGIHIGAKIAWRSGTIAGLGSGRICPNLQNINLSYVPDVLEFLVMLKVRQENAQLHGNGEGDGFQVKALTSVYLTTEMPPGVDFLLQSLERSGVEVYWRGP